ncbi:MAG: hypothetical protein ACKVHE_19135 [Planctomycetales bacterium]|jgi:hypothetical protein
MSQPDPFESQDQDHIPEKKGLSGCAIAGIGCGVIVVLGLIAVVVGGWWVANNVREFGTDIAVTAMKEGLNELEVPDDQRKRMHARIDDVGQRFKDGHLEIEQVMAIFKKLSESPILPAGVSLFVKRVYIRDSGLDEEEKSAADIAIQRFSRGVIDKSIPEAKREAVLDMISTKQPDGNREFQQKLTDDELRDFLKAVTETADEAGVPAEVPEINFADEFDEAIDEALGEALFGIGSPPRMDEETQALPIEAPDELNHESSETADGKAPDKAETDEAQSAETVPTESEPTKPAPTE